MPYTPNIKDLLAENETLRKKYESIKAINLNLMAMSVSERCSRYHLQCCHVCENLNCGDNTSKFKTTWKPK